MTWLELLLLSYLPVLLIGNIVLSAITWRRQEALLTKMRSLTTKIDQGMAGILELNADENV